MSVWQCTIESNWVSVWDFVVRQDDKYGCVVNGEERIPCNYYSVIVTEDYIITSLEGELNPRRAMDISNKHQVYDNGYRISDDGNTLMMK